MHRQKFLQIVIINLYYATKDTWNRKNQNTNKVKHTHKT